MEGAQGKGADNLLFTRISPLPMANIVHNIVDGMPPI